VTAALGQWAERAACIRYPADWWHSDDPFDQQQAVSVCATCPVQRECLNYAQDWREDATQTRPHGIWGGLLYPTVLPKLPGSGRRPIPVERSTACGRVVAYRRHLSQGEAPCHRCMMAMIKELRRQEKHRAGVWAR